MDPIIREDHNFTYKGGEGVGNLSGVKHEDGSFTAHFAPSEDELLEMMDAPQNGDFFIELTIFSQPIPPVRLRLVS